MIEMVSKHGTLKILSSTTIHAANKKKSNFSGFTFSKTVHEFILKIESNQKKSVMHRAQ